MGRDVIPHHIIDWSQLERDNVWSKIDLSSIEKSFGIHKYNGSFWSSGYVGVNRLFGKDGRVLQTNGKEHIVVATSSYGMDPWKMLETVLGDDEYEAYIDELERNDKFLFKVFVDQPLIRLAQDSQSNGSLLYALNYISSCYFLCKRGLKKSMYHEEQNFSSKVRGRINIRRNIRENTSRGRNERFACKYIDFTEDNLENRIVKAALLKCKEIVGQRFGENNEITSQIAFCLNVLKRVSVVRINTSDFNCVNVGGLYMYYKPVLMQAKSLYQQKYYSYIAQNGELLSHSVFTIPYMINMETLFEFYARTVLKKVLGRGSLAPYSDHLFLQDGVEMHGESEKGIHLMEYCIPDIVILNPETREPMIVIDAKYKPHSRAERSDSHQLLSYALLTGVTKCGFVFPGNETKLKCMSDGENYLLLRKCQTRYYELILGNTVDEKELTTILK